MNRLPFLMVLLAGTLGSLAGGCNKSDDAAGTAGTAGATGPTSQPSTAPAAAAAAGIAPAQFTAPATAPRSAAGPTSYPATTQPGRILVGDLLGVEVFDLTGPGAYLLLPKQVAADGTISMPFLSKPLAAAGMPTWGVEEAIAKAYKAENIIQHANVQVRRLRIAGTGGSPPGPIAAYDLVRIAIGDLTGPGSLSFHIGRVGGDGTVSLPYLNRQKVAGLTDQQVEAAIAKAYHDENIIQNAPVSVLRLEAAPPDAGRVDLPDVAIYPVPEVIRWLYEPQEAQPNRLAK